MRTASATALLPVQALLLSGARLHDEQDGVVDDEAEQDQEADGRQQVHCLRCKQVEHAQCDTPPPQQPAAWKA